MPNGKTHFIGGALVGASVNFVIQSAQLAMDYDRKFDWGEFFLCSGAGAFVGLGPRLCRRPAAETWNQETLPNLQRPNARNFLHLLPDMLEPLTIPDQRNVSLPLPIRWGEGWGEGNFPRVFEVEDRPNHRQFFHRIVSAGLIAYAISGQHTLKFSRTTRLFLWVFCMSYLSHIALGCTTPQRIYLIQRYRYR